MACFRGGLRHIGARFDWQTRGYIIVRYLVGARYGFGSRGTGAVASSFDMNVTIKSSSGLPCAFMYSTALPAKCHVTRVSCHFAPNAFCCAFLTMDAGP